MSLFVKRALHWTGTALAISGVVFVAVRLNEYSSQLDFSRFDRRTWFVVIILTFAYGLSNIFLAMAWWNLLVKYGHKASRLWAIRIYGLTQLAKYVPGNIMHLASRQTMGMAVGIPGWSLVKASVWELGLLSITGAFFFVLVLPQFLSTVSAPMSIIVFITITAFVAMLLIRFEGLPFARALGWYAIFLTISGMVFSGLLAQFIDESSITVSQGLIFCGAFVVAWLIGFVTPGAPAGIGIRELILMVLLKGLVQESDLLLAVLLSRLVTVSGDMLFFLLALRVSFREADFK